MIRPLRQSHRVIVCTLGVALPVSFIAGIAFRQPTPVAASVPAELAGNAETFSRITWTQADLWPGRRIITRMRQDASGSAAVDLMFRDLVKPDVLVYWVAGSALAQPNLPGNARLLGALSKRTPLRIPADARGEPGRFVLYSLADQEVVATSSAITLPKD